MVRRLPKRRDVKFLSVSAAPELRAQGALSGPIELSAQPPIR
ncbi:MAG TPA: hypothetical protein VIH74_04340 [Candidatus Acidoferrum sp.]